jgi:hypothetical protein
MTYIPYQKIPGPFKRRDLKDLDLTPLNPAQEVDNA